MSENETIIPVILSGGMGTRLWPLSRRHRPKQFLKLDSEEFSLIQQTYTRVADRSRFGAPVCVCNEDHRFLLAEAMQEMGAEDATILLEAEGRNTAPAIALAAHYIEAHYDNAVMLVLPSDHIIAQEPPFQAAIDRAVSAAAEGYLASFGMQARYAETGYGYIRKQKKALKNGIHPVAEFVEKPDQATAEGYVASGDYLWNSGMFAFTAASYLQELERYRKDISVAVHKTYNTLNASDDFIRFAPEAMAAVPSESIDYAVMERTDRAVVVPAECGWTDAGSFDALWQLKPKDAAGNVSEGDNQLMESRNCYVNSRDGIDVSLMGVEDLIVISTKDAVLVANRHRAQEIKRLVEHLKQHAPHLVNQYRQMSRPWGSYDNIELGERYQVKRLSVKPGASLSLQLHYHRAEHWIVVKGTALVSCDETRRVLSENQSFFVPCGAKHRLSNPGSIPLELIEVQSGSYLGEDDIVRFEDNYGRISEVK